LITTPWNKNYGPCASFIARTGAFSASVESRVDGVEVFLVHPVHGQAQGLAKALEMDGLALAQETDDVIHIRIVAHAQNIVIGRARLLLSAHILAEIGDFSRFDNPDQILAYAGLSPTTYQSGQMTSSYAHMEKRGSRYLRYALFNAAQYVCIWDPTFKAYLAKKRAEGKHYYVAISHACKKLVRVIYRMQLTGEAYRTA